jgi:magnesium transporter
MIVDCAVYENGRRSARDLSLEQAFEAAQRDAAFVWLGLHEPSHEEFERVRTAFHLHELAVEDAVNAHQRPKLEVYGDTLFLVLKPVHYLDREEVIETGEILLFVDRRFLVSVRHGDVGPLAQVRDRLEAQPEALVRGPGAVLHAILDRVVDGYAPVARSVQVDLDQIEEQVFSPERHNPTERIYKLQREVVEFDRAVTPLAEPLDRLATERFPLVDDELRNYFRDVHDHVLRTIQQIESFRHLLSSALQANLTQVGVRQNEDMRRITAWVAILAVPTMVAGIYGMNFDHMPELGWKLGYPAVLCLIAVVCSYLYYRFRRSGWL